MIDIKITELRVPYGTTDVFNGPKHSLFLVWYQCYFVGSFYSYNEALQNANEYLQRKRIMEWK